MIRNLGTQEIWGSQFLHWRMMLGVTLLLNRTNKYLLPSNKLEWDIVQAAPHWFQERSKTVWCSFLTSIKLGSGKTGRAEMQLRHSGFKAYWYSSLISGLYTRWDISYYLWNVFPHIVLMMTNQVSARWSSIAVFSVNLVVNHSMRL